MRFATLEAQKKEKRAVFSVAGTHLNSHARLGIFARISPKQFRVKSLFLFHTRFDGASNAVRFDATRHAPGRMRSRLAPRAPNRRATPIADITRATTCVSNPDTLIPYVFRRGAGPRLDMHQPPLGADFFLFSFPLAVICFGFCELWSCGWSKGIPNRSQIGICGHVTFRAANFRGIISGGRAPHRCFGNASQWKRFLILILIW